MFKKKQNNQQVDIHSLNEVIEMSKRILKLAYVLVLVLAIFVISRILKDWKLIEIALTLVKIIAPLFIGFIVAWILNPIVGWLKKKGIRRGFGTLITYVVVVGVIILLVSLIVPVLSEQLTDLAKTLPSVFDSLRNWIDGIFVRLDTFEGIDAIGIQKEVFEKLEIFGTGLAEGLPDMMVNFVKTLASWFGTIVIGLVIGFYFLLGFENINDTIITLVPKRFQKGFQELFGEIDLSLRGFVQGAMLDCTFVFLITSLGLWLVGLRAPLLFGLFCGITNIIPYAGPYIGGAPAVIVGFSISPTVGFLALGVIIVIQFLEGNFLQALIMSKTTKLHPVTIMLGLLIFGHFWGILGMVVSTPIISACKTIFMYFDEKYGIISEHE